MPISLFVLALWVFLQSATVYNWFSVDTKLVAFIGIVFVVVVVVEALLGERIGKLVASRRTAE